ncbi:hypothetical protein Nepgr_032003 [Nepenthes gracilis]|uniref:Uncharacterized protein n=1 Tax=Nepenthes gracilis TaxID=150966 RepID=A0AAD3TIH7_NEPGR|nr:hypothetical protein Nepgr_032003 [Nepenthes gracilis]
MAFFLNFWNLFAGFLIPRPVSNSDLVEVALLGFSRVVDALRPVTSQADNENSPLEVPRAGYKSVKAFLIENCAMIMTSCCPSRQGSSHSHQPHQVPQLPKKMNELLNL